jgi:hypothetical protein
VDGEKDDPLVADPSSPLRSRLTLLLTSAMLSILLNKSEFLFCWLREIIVRIHVILGNFSLVTSYFLLNQVYDRRMILQNARKL